MMAKKGRPFVFKHDAHTTTSVNGKHRFLVQDGRYFTFAEFNRQKRCWEPEPKYIYPDDLERLLVSDELAKVDKQIRELTQRRAELMPETSHGEQDPN
jgi:hypothetical protein